ncbi:hypothetical protein JCM4814A_88230 [Streptomyces phaeofaciens JCM 4814]|uniref:Uncharacterized protein n=1 Tax=Streptomyces phaeofaciens TaxID=68254 RepID=A0A918LTQ7_9ACTN|nr:hypothetical protein GCM10010226_31390 [Streptomyces phaeofaciens]
MQRQMCQRQEMEAAKPQTRSGQEQGEYVGENHGTAESVPQPGHGAGVHALIVIRPGTAGRGTPRGSQDAFR